MNYHWYWIFKLSGIYSIYFRKTVSQELKRSINHSPNQEVSIARKKREFRNDSDGSIYSPPRLIPCLSRSTSILARLGFLFQHVSCSLRIQLFINQLGTGCNMSSLHAGSFTDLQSIISTSNLSVSSTRLPRRSLIGMDVRLVS